MKMHERKQIVVVLGMHRSGTSAIVRGLKVLGVDLGERLLPAAADNPKGFWEDRDIYGLNVELLRKLDRDWHTLLPVLPNEFKKPDIDDFKSHAAAILRGKLSATHCFGLKDPRLARLLPFWQDVFTQLEVSVTYVIACRNPLSVARSLAKRDNFEMEKGYYLWLEHMVSSLSETADQVRVVVDYDRLVDDPALQLQRVANYLNRRFDPSAPEFIEYSTEFLEGALRHTRYGAEDLHRDNGVPENVALLYCALNQLSSDALSFNEPELQQLLARVRQQFYENYAVLRYVRMCEDKISALGEQLRCSTAQAGILEQTVAEHDRHSANLTQVLGERDRQIANLTQVLAERDRHIANLTQVIAERDRQIDSVTQAVAERGKEMDDILRSRSWRITRPLRVLGKFVAGTAQGLNRAGKHQFVPDALLSRYAEKAQLIYHAGKVSIRRNRGIIPVVSKVFFVLHREGSAGLKRSLIRFGQQDNQATHPVKHAKDFDRSDYTEWLRRYDTLSEETRAKMRSHIDMFTHQPLISVLMPVYNSSSKFLKETIESIRMQIYPYWELCIADNASSDKDIRSILDHYVREDARIKVVCCERKGDISAAANSALAMATGGWTALLNHNDLLAEHALFWVADTINKNRDVRLIYSDEDKIDETGKRFDPYFKCDWNVDLFYSNRLITRFGVYRTALLRNIGGFRSGFEGAQEYDMTLRYVELIQANQIHHIPSVLYSSRTYRDCAAQSSDCKSFSMLAGQRALNEHLKRIGIQGNAELQDLGSYRIRYALPDTLPMVSLIIPTRNCFKFIQRCVDGILNKTVYPNYEIVIVDNGSDEEAVLRYFENIVNRKDAKVRVVRDARPFNYSALNNAAVRIACGEIVGLVNNDIEIISPDWLSEMISHILRPDVGVVGARLWYPNDTLQHGGIILGICGWAGHAHKGFPKGQSGYGGRMSLVSEFTAVTGACLLIRKRLYETLGGLNETELQVACNDVDLCLRVREAGYRVIWTPYAELYHHESISRGFEDTAEKQLRFANELNYMKQRWGHLLSSDPAYSPNLTLEYEDFSFAWPPRLNKL